MSTEIVERQVLCLDTTDDAALFDITRAITKKAYVGDLIRLRCCISDGWCTPVLVQNIRQTDCKGEMDVWGVLGQGGHTSFWHLSSHDKWENITRRLHLHRLIRSCVRLWDQQKLQQLYAPGGTLAPVCFSVMH
jgi:hypothetical protein